MSAYVSREELERAISKYELAQLTNDAGGTEIDDAIVDDAIRYASELIDGYIAGRYPLPLQTVPTLLRPLALDIARYWLHGRRINAADFPDTLNNAYNHALKTLRDIRDGKIHLQIAGRQTEQPEPGAYHVRAREKQDWSGYP